MRTTPLVAILFSSLASCAAPGPAAAPGAQTLASFPPHGVADVIALQALNRLPLRAAALVAPDGEATAARDIVVHPVTNLGESALLGSTSFSGGTFGVAAVPASAAALGAPQARAELLLMRSQASLPLPDPVGYRRQWQHYRIRLRFGDPPGAVDREEIAAPAPPPG